LDYSSSSKNIKDGASSSNITPNISFIGQTKEVNQSQNENHQNGNHENGNGNRENADDSFTSPNKLSASVHSINLDSPLETTLVHNDSGSNE